MRPKPIRELRELLRYRRQLVRHRSAERSRLLNLLETANIKLASVLSDVFGVCGMRMLAALVDDGLSPQAMAALAAGRVRRKRAALEPTLEGRLDDHRRFLLRLQQLDDDLAVLDERIDNCLGPYGQQLRLLRQIPGWTTSLPPR